MFSNIEVYFIVMPAPFTYEQVKQIFEDAKCTLVSTTYETSKKKLEYKCSCGHPDIQNIRIADLKRGIRCPNCHAARLKATNKALYGYEHNSQRPEVREAALRGIMNYIANKKHKIDDLKEIYKAAGCELLETEYINVTVPMRFRCVCGREGILKYDKFAIGQRCSDPVCMDNRKKQTNLGKFGETSYTRTEAYKKSRKATCIKTYGTEHPMQNADVMAKADKKGVTYKLYTFPSGRQEKVQGYEPLALNHLLKIYHEDDIKLGRKEQPEIWYEDKNGTKHRYFSDIYIPKHNLIVEVKSSWTYTLGMNLGKIQLQEKACKDEGYEYLCLVFNDREKLLDNEKLSELISQEHTNTLIYEEDDDDEEFLECIQEYLPDD